MKKQILNLGKALNKAEQKSINGGLFGDSGCVLNITYEDGGSAMVSFEPAPGDPFATLACANHAMQVSPRLVATCTPDCTHL